MKSIPYVLIKSAMTLDGYLDDTSDKRLILSNKKDFAEVEKIRESCDAILVGAQTIRKDNPRLILQSGKKLMKVTITSSGNLDAKSNFFTMGDSEKIVYTITAMNEKLKKEIPTATIVSFDAPFTIRKVLEDLYERGVKRLLVEGGSTIITELLNENLVNELQISIAPVLLGKQNAPRLIKEEVLKTRINLQLESIERLDDIMVLKYIKQQLDNETMTKWIEYVIDLSKNSPPSDTAFAVGAALVDKEGTLIAEGYSREKNVNCHAEQILFEKIKDQNINFSNMTLYTSLEPCNTRSSHFESCVDLIRNKGIKRIVYAATEPPIFTRGEGAKRLEEEGKEVIKFFNYENDIIAIQTQAIQKQWKKTQ